MSQFILFLKNTLHDFEVHVSDGLSVHHPEIKTVRTGTGICQTELLASKQSAGNILRRTAL